MLPDTLPYVRVPTPVTGKKPQTLGLLGLIHKGTGVDILISPLGPLIPDYWAHLGQA